MDASQLRPLGVGEIIDAGVRITRTRFRDFAILVAIVTVPAQILVFLVTISAPGTNDTFSPGGSIAPGSTPDVGDTMTQLAATLVALAIGFVTTLLATSACTEVVSQSYLGGHADWRQSLRRFRDRFWSLLGINVLVVMIAIITGITCLLIPVGVWLWVAYSVAVPVILIEGVRGTSSLGRSFRLVRGRWWPVFSILLVGQLLVLVVQTFVTLPLLPALFVTDFENAAVNTVVSALSSVVGNVVTLPFVAAVTVIIYYDLRVRKEGFDLALMAQQLDAPAKATAAPAAAPEPTGRPDGDGGREAPPGWRPSPPPGWTPR